ncbi:YqxA family protein [Bacillus sp. FJAT-49736]|uniref:YqxA family protein n=1 Tax=Bacillus sp. FJAT-49736 TaxID=2833582 RepID=UPI001BC9E99E|nr:YqxA family protein [Bacillus sp. FJAT-49736]MBS4173595.1 YqxA family protein [Bacillus sp. FJAT-49736]
MTRFLIKCSLILALLFIGVLIGMEKANEGMVKMKGYKDSSLQAPFNINEDIDGKKEASVLGKNVTSHNLDKKKEHLENIKTYNLFSSLGKAITSFITSLTENIINLFSSFL